MKKFFNVNLVRIIISIAFFISALFFKNNPFQLVLLIISYVVISYPIYLEALDNIKEKNFFDENLLMIIATIGAFIIKNYEEAVMVMLLFEIGEYLSDLAVYKSKKSITELLNLRVDSVTLQDGNATKIIPVDDAQIDDIFIVKPGERVPLDGIVLEGTTFLDTYPLTGEAIPKKVTINDQILCGCINRDSLIKVKSTSTATSTTAARIMKLLSETEEGLLVHQTLGNLLLITSFLLEHILLFLLQTKLKLFLVASLKYIHLLLFFVLL